MGRFVKSITDTRELNQSVQELQKELKVYKNVVKRNSKELAKINAEVEASNQREIKILNEKLKKLETETQWIKNSEPALKVDSQHMLKKLDIL